MWTAIVVFLVLAVRAILDPKKITPRMAELLLILVIPISMSPRAWFGSTQGVVADISAACYPFLMVLGPYLLWSFLSSPSPRIPAVAIVAAITIVYGFARLAGGAALLTDKRYRSVETAAGRV